MADCSRMSVTGVMPRFDLYRNVSNQIMQIFLEYTDKVEPLSLDEAFLDVTVNHKGNRSATIIAKEIKQKILNRTRLTASAGVSYNYKKMAIIYTVHGDIVYIHQIVESGIHILSTYHHFGIIDRIRKIGLIKRIL